MLPEYRGVFESGLEMARQSKSRWFVADSEFFSVVKMKTLYKHCRKVKKNPTSVSESWAADKSIGGSDKAARFYSGFPGTNTPPMYLKIRKSTGQKVRVFYAHWRLVAESTLPKHSSPVKPSVCEESTCFCQKRKCKYPNLCFKDQTTQACVISTVISFNYMSSSCCY